MKTILLSTALSLVFAAPVYAEDLVKPPSMDAATEAAAEEAVSEAKEMVQEAAAETAENVIIESAPEAAPEPLTQPAEDMVKEEAMDAATEAVHAEAHEGQAHDHAAEEMAQEAPASGGHAAHVNWGYSGAGAAPYWGTLDAAYETCATGQKQSPINIAKFLQEDVPDLQPSYQASQLSVKNNGHTIQVNFEPGSILNVGGITYNLKHAHFHTPSEHYLDGAPYPMELHFMHQADDGTLGMVGVMMKAGEHNPVIEGIWQNAPIQTGGEKTIESVEISAADLLPVSKEYYKYEGSITTPPCTEGVQWHVLKDPIEISELQLKAFQALFPVNARPVQALNDRVVTGD